MNHLWFASLTLSLVSAFFAIAAQQWLRQVAITPRYLSIQDAARLRQRRYDGLMDWQIPSIIAFLPLLIQIAVVLFLAGLLVLLEPLDHGVASSFAAIAGIALILFVFTALSPLVASQCPYKSPFVPAVLAVFQWLATPAITIVFLTLGVVSSIFLLFVALIYVVSCCNDAVLGYVNILVDLFFSVADRTTELLITLVHPQTVGLQRFWTNRETKAMSEEPGGPNLPVLSSAIAAASCDRLVQLRKALPAFTPEQTRLCVLIAVARAVRFQSSGSDLVQNDSSERRQLCSLITKAAHTKHTLLHEDHITLMEEVLPTDWSQINEDSVTPLILLLLHLATFVNKKPHPPLFHAAISAREHQTIRWDGLSLETCTPTFLICLHVRDDVCAEGCE